MMDGVARPASTRRAGTRPRRLGNAMKRVGIIVVALVLAGCQSLPSELPSLPAVPSIPALPTIEPSLPAIPTEKPKPTEAPTAKPTEAPTAKPTEAPAATQKPTEAPTATAEPTAAPTATAKPTAAPTPKPSPTPTQTTVTISGAFDVGFIASSLSGPAPLAVTFGGFAVLTVDGVTATAPLSSDDATSQLWTFGDDEFSFEQTPTHIYPDPGLYTVTLTVAGANGTGSRIKQDLIAVGPLAQLQATRQEPAFVDTPAFWVAAAVSPPLAAFLAARDRIESRRQDGQGLLDAGHGLIALIGARDDGTSPGAMSLAIEAYLDRAGRAHGRFDGPAQERLDRSAGIAADLQRLLMIEALVRKVSPDDTRLTAMNQAIEERLQDFSAALEELGRDSQ